jgi:hypothetical protein
MSEVCMMLGDVAIGIPTAVLARGLHHSLRAGTIGTASNDCRADNFVAASVVPAAGSAAATRDDAGRAAVMTE